MKRISKILAMIMALVMCVSCFTACSLFDKSPKTATELLAKSNEVVDSLEKNMHAEMKLGAHIEMAMEAEGAKMSIDLPIEMTAKIDMAGDYTHMKMEMEGKAEATTEYNGEKQTDKETIEESAESYVVVDDDEVITYTNDGDDIWYVSTEDKEDESFNVKDLLDEGLFENAEMTKDGDNYVVKVKLADIMNNEKVKDALEDSDSIDMESMGIEMDIDEIIDVIGDTMVTYKFDKEYRPIEMSTGEIQFDVSKMLDEDEMEEIGMDPDDIEISMELTIKFSKFGEIEESDVKVPKSVKNEAVDASDIDIDDDDNDNSANVTDPDDNQTEPTDDNDVDKEPVVSDGKMSNNWEDMTIEIDGVVYEFPYDYDLLSANGWKLDLVGMGYEDGYILNKNDQLTGTIDLYNEKYNSPDDWDAMTFWCGFQNFGSKAADITECDLWCIEIDIMNGFDLVEKYPDVKIAKGITWGSTMDEVIAAFGEPADKYESKGDGYDYARLEWRNDNGKYMTLTVDAKLGVTAIEIDCY